MALPAIEMIARLASQRRMGILPDASAGAPHHFPIHRVEDHRWLDGPHRDHRLCYGHVRGDQRSSRVRGEDPGMLLPGVNPGWPGAGCWAPTRARARTRTCRAT